jgi:hypothetical protein
MGCRNCSCTCTSDYPAEHTFKPKHTRHACRYCSCLRALALVGWASVCEFSRHCWLDTIAGSQCAVCCSCSVYVRLLGLIICLLLVNAVWWRHLSRGGMPLAGSTERKAPASAWVLLRLRAAVVAAYPSGLMTTCCSVCCCVEGLLGSCCWCCVQSMMQLMMCLLISWCFSKPVIS